MGGGILLLAVMAQYFPLQALIPLHGLIQLGSNGARTVFSFRSVRWNIASLYAAGGLFGAAIGSQLVIKVPEGPYKVVLGIFILLITFISLPKTPIKGGLLKWPLLGAISTFLGLFVGATGPLLAPFYLSERLTKETLVATKAACQIFTHLLKVAVFFAMGFSLGPHMPIFIGMLGMVILGNYIGKLILHRVPDRLFILSFKVLIVLLSARMIWQGFCLLAPP